MLEGAILDCRVVIPMTFSSVYIHTQGTTAGATKVTATQFSNVRLLRLGSMTMCEQLIE